MPRDSDLVEQGRFEGKVLQSLKNLTANVNEVKGDVKDCKSEIAALATAQAVQAEAHENLTGQVAGLVEAHAKECADGEHCGESKSNGFLRIIIPVSALTSVVAIISAAVAAEIIKRCF